MSREVLEIIQGMNLKDIETQLALQCAPLIAGLKVSNLLNIENVSAGNVKRILKDSNISYAVLLETNYKTTYLLYHDKKLRCYLKEKRIETFLQQAGYNSSDLDEILPEFRKRYQGYMSDSREFPHEMGLLLGYPLEDVEGFILNEGKNFLYTGYWKVYANLSSKIQLFQKFEVAKETMIHLVSNGVSMVDVIDIYSEDELRKAAI